MNPAQQKEELKKFLWQIQPLDDAAWAELTIAWQDFSSRRKTLLTRAGDTENYLYFVLEGIQRAYYLHDNDREATIVFTYPYSFSGLADSFLTRRPSRFFLETLTASRFLRISYTQVEQLMKKHRAVESLFFRATAMALAGVLERLAEVQSYSSEEKFRALLCRSPHVLTTIPHKYLASYLGIDASTFSKLLGSVKI